jgi:hypothetical protein
VGHQHTTKPLGDLVKIAQLGAWPRALARMGGCRGRRVPVAGHQVIAPGASVIGNRGR